MQVQGRDPGLGCVGLGGSVEGAGSLGREGPGKQRTWRSFSTSATGPRGATGGREGRSGWASRDRAACQLGRPGSQSAALEWRPPSSMQVRADRPRCNNACNEPGLFSVLLLAATTSIFRRVMSKKRKATTTPGRAGFWWSAHNRNRDFLLRIQNRSLVRPELIRSKDGMIDGDGGSAGTVESAGTACFPVSACLGLQS